jgi:hypothetical protein
VDDEFHVIGMVGESELFPEERDVPFSLTKIPALFKQWVAPNWLEEIHAESRHHTADVMDRSVFYVGVNNDIGQAAGLTLRHKLTSFPSLRDRILEGIVSRSDILRLLAKSE